MKEYLFGCIMLSLIAAILSEGVPKSLESGVKSAVGVGLIVFAAMPLGGMITGAMTIPMPDVTVPDISLNEFEKISRDAYIEGVTLALADRYSCPASDFKVSVDGFDGINLTSEIMHVTLSGKAKYVDYRELSQYIESELKVVKCDVQMEIS